MNSRWRRMFWTSPMLAFGLAGCSSVEPFLPAPPPVHRLEQVKADLASGAPRDDRQPAILGRPSNDDGKIVQAQAKEITPKAPVTKEKDVSVPRPAYARQEDYPIDLPTAIRLVNAQSPAIGIAQAKVQEAQAKLDGAEVMWLPNASGGAIYQRFDGNSQNQTGNSINVSRANLFASGGLGLNLDVAEAIYRPMIERQALASESQRAQATNLNVELEVVSAYLDLLQVYAQNEINNEILKLAESMLKAAENAKAAKLDRAPGDVNRAMSEVLTRRIERIDIEGRIGVTSARLARVLQLPANVKLIPVERLVVPITLVDNNATMEDLMTQAMANRPDLGAFKEAIAGALAREKRYRYGPFIPKLAIADQVGSFGGGLNDRLAQFGERNLLSAQVFWEIKNFGLGNMAELRERKANVTQANYQLIEAQAKAGAEIVEAAQQSAARAESLEFAKKAVGEAEELYRINKEGTFNVVDAKNLFDALRPLQSIQLLNQARTSYLNAIVEYNRAQYRLFTAIGRAPGTAPK